MSLNPKTDENLECHLLFRKRAGNIYCIGSKESDRYIAVQEDDASTVYRALLLLDGTRSIEEAQRIFNEKIAPGCLLDIGRLYEIALRAGIADDGLEDGDRVHDETDLMLVDIKTVCLGRLLPILEFAARHILVIIVAFILLVLCAAVVAGGVDFSFIYSLFSDPMVLIFAWTVQTPSILLHELAHAVVATRVGARPKQLSICVFYYMSLALYVRIPGIYFLPPWKRIAVWCSGAGANLLLSASFLVLSAFCPSSFRLFLFVGMFVNLMMAVGNLMPFMYSDGYYILSTLLKRPNLRKKSLFGFRELVRSGVTRETFPYWAYLLLTIAALIVVGGGQVILFLRLLVQDIAAGASAVEIICHYKNLLLMVVLGVTLRLIRKWKSEKNGR